MIIRFTLAISVLLSTSLICSAGEQAKVKQLVFKANDSDVAIEDGDSFWLGIHRVRLHGIDAMEPDQTCRQGDKIVECAEESRRYLETLATNSLFECRVHFTKEGRPKIRYNRYVATCYIANKNVNEDMVRLGYALAAHTSDGDGYRELEQQAKARGVGLHATTYTPPWKFRQKTREPNCECDCD